MSTSERGADNAEPTSASSQQGDNATSFPFVMYSGPSNQDENTGRFVRQYVMRGSTKPRGNKKQRAQNTSPSRRIHIGRSFRIPRESKLSLYQMGQLGGSRSDPFARYPIEMDNSSWELVEYCECFARLIASH